MSRQRRTESLNVNFAGGMAAGWAFGVADAFRMTLDMRYDGRIDADASSAKELRLGRKLQPNEKVLRYVWTQGVPRAYSFGRGHIFHDPPIAHGLAWDVALPLLRRSIVVLDSKADPGALVEIHPDDGEESVVVEESGSNAKAGRAGWVDIEVLYYEDGRVVDKEKTTRTQAGFVDMLRTGKDPLNPAFDACHCGESSATYTCLRCSRQTRQPETLPLFDGVGVAAPLL
jgi:hypothetical protein